MSYQGGNKPGQRLATGKAPSTNPAWQYGSYVDATDQLGIDPTGVLDSTTGIQNAFNLFAPIGIAVYFPPGTYLVSAPISCPSNLKAFGAGRELTTINSTVPATVSPDDAPFNTITGLPALGVAPISAANAVGSNQVTVANLAAGAVSIGVWTYIADTTTGSGFQGGLYQVKSIAGVAPAILTLDRPVLYSFGIGDTVTVPTLAPHDISLSDMRIQGSGTRLFEAPGTRECLLARITFAPSAAVVDLVASYDNFGFHNCYDDCECDGGGTATVAFAFETQDSSWMTKTRGGRVTGTALNMYDCASCSIDETCQGYLSGAGAGVTADGNVIGCHDCTIEGDYYTNTIGVGVNNGSSNTKVNANARFNLANNILVGDPGSTVRNTAVQGNFGSTSGTGVAVSFTARGTKLSVIDTTDAALGLNINIGADVDVSGWTMFGTTTNAIVNAGKLKIRGSKIDVSVGGVPINLVAMSSGEIDISESDWLAPTNSNLFNMTGGKLVFTQFVGANAGGGGDGVFATAGTIRVGEAVDLSGVTNELVNGGVAFFSRMQVTANGTTPVVVPWPDLKSTDRVRFQLLTPVPAAPVLLGDLSVTYNPGVGFTFAGTQTLNGSLYDAIVE